MQPEAGDTIMRADAAVLAALGPLLAQLIVFPVFGFCLPVERTQPVTAALGAVLALSRVGLGVHAGSAG